MVGETPDDNKTAPSRVQRQKLFTSLWTLLAPDILGQKPPSSAIFTAAFRQITAQYFCQIPLDSYATQFSEALKDI